MSKVNTQITESFIYVGIGGHTTIFNLGYAKPIEVSDKIKDFKVAEKSCRAKGIDLRIKGFKKALNEFTNEIEPKALKDIESINLLMDKAKEIALKIDGLDNIFNEETKGYKYMKELGRLNTEILSFLYCGTPLSRYFNFINHLNSGIGSLGYPSNTTTKIRFNF